MCIIHALAVDYDYCCQGLGKMLVNHIISDAKERGSEAIHLDAIDNNCNLTEYLTKRTFEREIRCEVTGNDGKPRKIKGFRELTRSFEVRL